MGALPCMSEPLICVINEVDDTKVIRCQVAIYSATIASSAMVASREDMSMLTTTRDMMLPTAITGSYPRPLWYDANLGGRSFKAALGDSLFREQYLDAVAAIINAPEAGGLDIVTDGDSRFDLAVGAKSWFFYPIERLG